VWQVTEKETPEAIAARKEKQAQEAAEYPLHTACVQGELRMAKHLLQVLGYQAEAYNHKDATPLFLAAQGGHLPVVKFLIEEMSANPELGLKPPKQLTPMFVAAQNGHVPVLKYLCREAGAHIDKPTTTGITPIFYAAKEGRCQCIEYLLQRKVDANRQLPDGTSPIFIAAEYGQLEAVRMLITLGQVIVDQPRKDGKTAIRIASENGHVQILKALVVLGGASWELLSDQAQDCFTTRPARPHYS